MHNDDRPYVTKQLTRLASPPMRQDVLQKYNLAFDEAYANEPLSHRKTGRARYIANNKLRAYIDYVTGVYIPKH